MDSEEAKVKSINSLLNVPKTRALGLKSLSVYLPDCSDDKFVEWCITWMQNCCKSDGINKDIAFTIEILSELFKISSNYPELYKNVSIFITSRFFDHFFKHFLNFNCGWTCAKNCFSLYRGPCGPFQDNIAKHLNEIIMKNKKISDEVSDCYALLPSLGGGGNDGVNYKTNWKNQFEKFMQISHAILNDLYVDINEIQEYDTAGHSYTQKSKKFNIDYLVTQLYNYCRVLSSMLLNSYPAVKCISTELLLELVCRGLAVNPTSLGETKITSLISLKQVLPQIHQCLLQLLKSVIATCGKQLLPYSYLICKLIKQTLDCTTSEKHFRDLRISAYEVLCNWLVTTKSGGCLESISKKIIAHIATDITVKTIGISLKETNSTSKNSSNSKQYPKRRIDASVNDCLCYSALMTLQYFLKFYGVLLKPADHKQLQETVVRLLVNIQKSFPTDLPVPYSASKCRKSLYGVLVELVNQPCPKWPPPTNFALRLLKNGENDSCLQVSQYCSSALNAITVIIHHQFSNGPFTIYERGNDGQDNCRDLIEDDEPMDVDVTSREELMDVEQELVLDDAMSGVQEDSKHSFESTKETEQKLISTSSDSCHISKTPTPERELIEEEEREEPALQESNFISNEEESVVDGQSQTPELIEDSEGEPLAKKSKIDEEINSEINTSIETETPKRQNSESSPQPPIKMVVVEGTTSSEVVKSPEKIEISDKSYRSPIASEEPLREKSATPELTVDPKFLDIKRRYSLRSKGKGDAEDQENNLKRSDSVDSPRRTPVRTSGRSTPLSVSRRPRTRALSKLEENEEESATPKKGEKEDEDIIEAFDDTLAE